MQVMGEKQSPRTPKRKKSAGSLTHLELWPHQVQGGKYVRILQRHVNALREESPHGNRALFLDDIFLAYLLAFFNPSLRSLRTIEDFSQTRQAQRHLSIPRICKSTLADFHHLVDTERLKPIVTALREAVEQKRQGSHSTGDLHQVLQDVVAVDGTFLPAFADVTWAICERNNTPLHCHRARVDCQVDVRHWVPEVMTIPEPGQSEAESAKHTITPGAIHLYDRGYISYSLLAAHYTKGSIDPPTAHFVLRLRQSGSNSPEFKQPVERPLGRTGPKAGIVADRLGRFEGLDDLLGEAVCLREVVVALDDGTELRLLTNLLDLPAEVIATLYRQRWQIELFFRWLKYCANFDHLISHTRSGMQLNLYVVLIGMMLLYLHIDGRPSKYLFNMLQIVSQGGASLEEILPILREREHQCEVARRSAALRRAKKKAEGR
jgi:hypothetical protein